MEPPEYRQIYALLLRYSIGRADGDVEGARRYQRAGVARIRRALRCRPTPALWNMLADFYARADKWLSCYRAALALDGRDIEACYGMASYEFDYCRRPRRALVWVERYLDRVGNTRPIDALALRLAARVFRACAKERHAQRCERKANRVASLLAKDPTTARDALHVLEQRGKMTSARTPTPRRSKLAQVQPGQVQNVDGPADR